MNNAPWSVEEAMHKAQKAQADAVEEMLKSVIASGFKPGDCYVVYHQQEQNKEGTSQKIEVRHRKVDALGVRSLGQSDDKVLSSILFKLIYKVEEKAGAEKEPCPRCKGNERYCVPDQYCRYRSAGLLWLLSNDGVPCAKRVWCPVCHGKSAKAEKSQGSDLPEVQPGEEFVSDDRMPKMAFGLASGALTPQDVHMLYGQFPLRRWDCGDVHGWVYTCFGASILKTIANLPDALTPAPMAAGDWVCYAKTASPSKAQRVHQVDLQSGIWAWKTITSPWRYCHDYKVVARDVESPGTEYCVPCLNEFNNQLREQHAKDEAEIKRLYTQLRNGVGILRSLGNPGLGVDWLRDRNDFMAHNKDI